MQSSTRSRSFTGFAGILKKVERLLKVKLKLYGETLVQRRNYSQFLPNTVNTGARGPEFEYEPYSVCLALPGFYLIVTKTNDMQRPGFTKTVILTGLLAGTLDLFSAYISQWIKTGAYSAGMLKYIAGGALGLETSMKGGNGVAFLGLFFHYFIAMSFTVLFFLVFPRLKFLWYDKYLVGVLYAVFVALVVNQLILPLTPLPTKPFDLSNAVQAWFILSIALGIPIAVRAYRFYGVEGTERKKPVIWW
jgi:hypothetical protein